jgi:hypothetical protein
MKLHRLVVGFGLPAAFLITADPALAEGKDVLRQRELSLRPDVSRAPDEDPRHRELPDTTLDRAIGPLDFEMELDDAILLGAFQDEAQDAPAAGGGDDPDLAEKATNPVAPLIQLQLQNTMVGESKAGSGYSNTFTVQPVIPWKIGKRPMLSRITLPLLASTPDLGDPIGREYGLGDTIALNFAIWHIEDGPWKGMIGPGVAFTFPTASSDFLGQGKWQTGPGFVYVNTATPGLQWGGFLYQQWSYASSGGDSARDEVSMLFFQPIITKHFEKGWYVSLGDIPWSIDWNDDARWSLPLGVRVGRVTKLGNQPINVFVEPFYDISGNNKGNEWGVKLSLTLLFPTK